MKKSSEPRSGRKNPSDDSSPSASTKRHSSLPLTKEFPIVGIGASAGGLEAFTQLLQNLRPDTGMAFVLVQHLDPDHESALSRLLAKSTTMTVIEVTNGISVRPNSIYVIPPNASMLISRGILRLQPRQNTGGAHRSIDFFFESLAQDQSEQAIGVILSGTATDGTQGAEAIKAEGGITFAQDDSAKYDSMPRSAVAAGCIDFILSPKEIAVELARIAKHPLVASPKTAARPGHKTPNEDVKGVRSSDEGAFRKILELLRQHRGVDFFLYKPNTIERRINRRMVLNKLDTLADYASFLKGNSKELDHLYSDILINVTTFFRNPEAFETLKHKVFPKLLEDRRQDEPVRIWTLGCSTGEEAYSIAMAYTEFSQSVSGAPKLQVFATDLNDDSLDKARNGLYSRNAVADVSPGRLRRFFIEEQGGYRISKALRESCVFARQNVLSDPPFSRMDLISCRNLLIYIETGLQKKILPNFHYALKPKGFLLLGASEAVAGFTNLFEPVDKKNRIFSRKNGVLPSYHLPVSENQSTQKKEAGKKDVLPESFRGEPSAQREADRVIAGRLAPPGVLINDDLEVLQFRGATKKYLEPPVGKASFNLLKMARPGLMLPLRATINEARKKKGPASRQNVRMEGEENQGVNIEVIPLKNLKESFYLVLFRPTRGAREPEEKILPKAKAEKSKRSSFPSVTESQRLAELDRELAETREYVQSLQEQHEAANEELQASNEEVQSANEELQSINEELETSKEELESTNEELTTINDEMATRNSELNRLNSDLNNFHVSINTAIILLDRDLMLCRFTPLAEKIFNLLPGDVGRPLKTVRHNLDFSDLEAFLTEVIDKITVQEREVQDKDGRWYVLRARPYVNLDNKIDGAVLLLINIDDLKFKEQEIKEARDYAQGIVETVPPLLILDENLEVLSGNDSFYKHFGIAPEQVENILIYELGKGQWNIPKLRRLLESILPRNSFFEDFEVTHDFGNRGTRTLLLSGRRLDSTHRVLLSIEDVTERLHLEESVRQSELRYRRLFETAQDGILILDAKTRKITKANPFVLDFLEYAPGEMLGKELWEIGLLKDDAACQEAFQRLKAKGSIRFNNLTVKSKTGISREAESVCNLYQEGDEEVIQCNIRDISERKRAEEALRHSEKQYRDLFNSIDEGFCVVEMIFDQNEKPVDYRFLEVNPSFERQTGLHDVIGKRMRELRSDHEDYWFETYGKIAKTGQAMRFVNEAKSLGGRWFDVYAFRLSPHQDEKIGILFQDISERLKTEQIRNRLATQLQEELTDTQRLQETSTLLIQKGETQSLYEHILAAGVSVMRSDMATLQIVDEKKDALRLLVSQGFDPAFEKAFEFCGRESKTSCATARNSGQRVIVSDVETCDFLAGTEELENLRKAGVRAVQSTPLMSRSGRLIGMVSTHWRQPHQPGERELRMLDVLARQAADLIERTHAEEGIRRARAELADHAGGLEQAVSARTKELTETNKQLETFVYSIAHDLRAPLRAMEGFSAMLAEAVGPHLDPTGHDLVNRIGSAAQFMDAMLLDLLMFSRISQQQIEMTSVNLKTVAEREVSQLESEIRMKNAKIELLGPWPSVLAHESTLGEVLSNLLANALKFTRPEVPPVIQIRTEEVKDSIPLRVKVTVEDNGIGIESRHWVQIFRLFSRLHGEKFPGTGFGLAIVQKAVERMGGHVGVESTPGRGSRFWFELGKAESE